MAGASLDSDEGNVIDKVAFDIVEKCRNAIDDLSVLQHMLADRHSDVETVDDGGEVEEAEDGDR